MRRGKYYRTRKTREKLSKSVKKALSNPETRQKMATAKIVEGTRSALQDILGEAAELYIEWDGQDKWHGPPIRWDWSGWGCLPVVGGLRESCCNVEEGWIAIPFAEVKGQMIFSACREIAHVLAGTYRHNLEYVKKLGFIALEARQQYEGRDDRFGDVKGIPDLILRYMEECLVLDESKGYWKNVGTKKGGGIVIQREYVSGHGTKEPVYKAKTYQGFHSLFQISAIRRLSFPPRALWDWEAICKEFHVSESTKNNF